jgi:hypothetical protein
VDEVLAKAHDWIQAAISLEEVSGGFPVSFLKASRFETLALCVWLRTGHHDVDALQKAVHHWNEYFETHPASVADPYVLGLHSSTYLDAGLHHDLLRWIKRNQKILLAKPVSKIKSELGVAGAVALHKSEGTYSEAEIARAIHKLLDGEMNDWLTTGQQLKAVRWLKLAYWRPNESGASARDVVLKAYNHLPAAVATI